MPASKFSTTKKARKSRWVTYSRCCFLTWGALTISLVPLIFYFEGHARADWPGWSYLLLVGILILGCVLLGIGLFTSRKKTDAWMKSSTTHEASFIVMLIAAPLYFLLKAFERKR